MMERLTERKTSCWIKTKSGKDYTNYTQDWEAIDRLAEYEDTGLTPEQAQELKERDMAKKVLGGRTICPECGATVLKCYDFCRDCGQRLKWGE